MRLGAESFCATRSKNSVYLGNPLFQEEGSPVMATGVIWLDRIVEQANFPPTVDREGAALVLSQLLGFTPSKHTVRSWPIPYRVVGKYSRYRVSDLIEFARRRLEEAPVRTGPGTTNGSDASTAP
jgi:hypothetical protein